MKNVIYIDMDGVLADFDTYCISLIGKTLQGFDKSQDGWDALGEARLDMYSKLKPMSDAHTLVFQVQSLAKVYGYSVAVLTAVPKIGRVPLAKHHKKEWLDRYFPELMEDFNIGPHAEDKQKHCNVGDILIDDSKMNIPQWNSSGGFGILHTSADTTIQMLKEYLKANVRSE